MLENISRFIGYYIAAGLCIAAVMIKNPHTWRKKNFNTDHKRVEAEVRQMLSGVPEARVELRYFIEKVRKSSAYSIDRKQSSAGERKK